MQAIVSITERGVITLPARLRKELGLKPDDLLIAETRPEGLLLRPAVTLPVELYTAEREREFDAAEAELQERPEEAARALSRMRIFLDANILFSAAKSDGAVRTLLRLLQSEGHALVADGYVVEEARRNLARKTPGLPLESLDKLLTVIEVATVATDVTGEAAWLEWLPMKDRPVLAAAAKLQCAVLITGDRTHFESGYGKQFAGVMVLSPAMAADRLLA